MRLLVAIGGNALTSENSESSGQIDEAKIDSVVKSLVRLEKDHTLLITHGNGPQVGWLAMQEMESNISMDLLDAQSEGMLGYRLAQAMDNYRQKQGTLSLLTRVVVDPDDPALSHPSKPVGPVLDADRADRLADQQGWQFTGAAGGKRRLVASPKPVRVMESDAIATLMEAGYSVICAGGGGIPVVHENERYRGISAVIDKDHTSALLASELKLDGLLLLTGVDALYQDWGTPAARAVRRIGCNQLDKTGLAEGSMAPKVEAACRFVNATGGVAGIGLLDAAQAILDGSQGTRIVAGDAEPEWW